MRREDQWHRLPPFFWDLLQRPPHAVSHRPDETGVIEEHPQLVDLRSTVANFFSGPLNILTILTVW